MTTARGVLPALCLLLAVGACEAPEPAQEVARPAAAPAEPLPTPPDPTPAPTPAADAEPAEPAEPPPAAAPLSGIGPDGAEGREARRQAVLDLLTDGRSAGALELAATDPKRRFDPDLADALTPRIVITPPARSIPAILQGAHTVKGPLDKDIVRRIVRAHLNELRHCYSAGLAKNPNLAGRVVVDFQILESGGVGESQVRTSTLADAAVGQCVARAIKRWMFPKPSALVEVTYPFELKP